MIFNYTNIKISDKKCCSQKFYTYLEQNIIKLLFKNSVLIQNHAIVQEQNICIFGEVHYLI